MSENYRSSTERQIVENLMPVVIKRDNAESSCWPAASLSLPLGTFPSMSIT